MTDAEFRSHFQLGADAVPDFFEILNRPNRRYRPRPLALGLLMLVAIAPFGWAWTNRLEEKSVNIGDGAQTIIEGGPVVGRSGGQKSSPPGAAAPATLTPTADGLPQRPRAQGATCKLDPIMTTHTLPPYPEDAAQLHETGTTSLEVTVARDGHISDATVTQSSGFPSLDAAAASYVRQNYLWQPMACASLTTVVNVAWRLKSPTDNAH